MLGGTGHIRTLTEVYDEVVLAYAVDVNILGGGIHTLKENATVLVFASKETGREVNADKTEYVLMSRDQNAGQYLNMKNDNSSFFMFC